MHRVHIDLIDRNTARTIAAVLEESVTRPPLAVSVFEAPPNGWTIDAYYEDEITPAEFTDIIGDNAPANDVVPQIEAVPDENWVAISQAGLPPVAAGRFLVHGSHDRAVGRQHRNAIEIDAGEAFGTAHHATTLGCLLAIDRLTRSQRFNRVLDLGCGSGVLAIAAGRVLPDAQITASDSDPEAIRVATENVTKNALRARIRPLVAMGLTHPTIRQRGPFDLVIANILADPLIGLAQKLAQAMAPTGVIVLSGILERQAPQVLAAYAAAGFSRRRIQHLNGWVTLTLSRRSSRRGGVSV
jgi:ribosomal protein L11 methyltransferase